MILMKKQKRKKFFFSKEEIKKKNKIFCFLDINMRISKVRKKKRNKRAKFVIIYLFVICFAVDKFENYLLTYFIC